MKKWLQFFCFLCLSLSAFAEETSVLFVLYDAGETNALLPVIEKCKQENVPYKVMAFGTAQTLISDYLDTGLKVDVAWTRMQELSKDEISTLQSMVQPKIVVSGVASKIQGQLLEAYRGAAKTIAFWDNFSASGANDYFTVAKEVQKEAELVLFPSKTVAEAEEFSDRPEEQKYTVGHPIFDSWREKLSLIDRKTVLDEMHCNPDRMVVTYIGSYGPEYERAYELFLDYAKRLETDYNYLFQSENEKANIFVQAHPKTDAGFEKEHSLPYFHINELSTLEAIAVADMVVCYNSTAGFQALLLGKDLVYFIPEGDPLTNSAIDMGLVKKISSPADFESFNKARINAVEFFGIPDNSVDKIFELIKQ